MELLIKLFIILMEGKEGFNFLDVVTTLMGGNIKILASTIKNLSLKQELALRKRFGNNIVNQAKKSVGVKTLSNLKPTRTINAPGATKSPTNSSYTNAKDISEASKVSTNTNITISDQSIPTTATTKSGWIQSISWEAELHVLTLKTKKSPIYYKLPFFPRGVAEAMLVNESPGKTLWSGYWRVFGRGGGASGRILKNVKKRTQSNVITRMNKISNKSVLGRKILTNSQVRKLNIPKTGIKGIKIKRISKLK